MPPPLPAAAVGWRVSLSSASIGGSSADKNHVCRLLDDFQALGEQRSVALIQVDVVGRRVVIDQADRLAHHERDGLGFQAPVWSWWLPCVLSALCKQSRGLLSWTSVENSSALDCPGRMAMRPP